MPDLGLEVLLKGKNFIRLLAGLGTALQISMVSVGISIPLGIVLGIFMTGKNPWIKAILRIYLEIIRIMPQMVLLKGIWMEFVRGECLRHCLFFLGNCGDERPCKGRIDQHSCSPV